MKDSGSIQQQDERQQELEEVCIWYAYIHQIIQQRTESVGLGIIPTWESISPRMTQVLLKH